MESLLALKERTDGCILPETWENLSHLLRPDENMNNLLVRLMIHYAFTSPDIQCAIKLTPKGRVVLYGANYA